MVIFFRLRNTGRFTLPIGRSLTGENLELDITLISNSFEIEEIIFEDNPRNEPALEDNLELVITVLIPSEDFTDAVDVNIVPGMLGLLISSKCYV
ncbi:hypothetical protein TNIN_283601 [Trichonephila inaurata madagascariensis]|uniref:Uncharacterized protein n=1 Tax=Trichonephila inaurata madagascariensis TaxID=2747483 RepID=A0A8X6XBV7_9ARAC|nr:hypothetical protein TNIN_283601 [Trichonephila inaurata madagascariensis]